MTPITADDPHAKSADIVAGNIAALCELFPEAFAEGKIDFDVLKQLLGGSIDEREEKYGMNWHGKRRARQLALTPSTGTLRPCPGDGVDEATTRNVVIEGDNLEVLKLLQKSYSGKVKLIYIDPPYNTGNDFIYPDDFQDNVKNYLQLTGQTEGGAKLTSNPETSGRFHTDWLNMMYPRLKLMRNLMANDGLLFVSIDDAEVASLRRICDDVFGEENFIATLIWQKVFSPKNTARHFSEDHDYIVCYAKSKLIWTPQLLPRSDEATARYTNPDNDPRGDWTSSDLTARNFYGAGQYTVTGPTGKEFGPGRGRYWRQDEKSFKELDRDNRIWWGEDRGNMPRLKRFLTEVKDGVVPQTLLLHTEVGNTQEAKKELLEYVAFEETENVLNSVKPTRLLQHLIKIGTRPNSADVVMDFFGGSGPLGHAVMQQNAEDGGDRRYLLVQIAEKLPKEEATVKTIFDLTKSRLRNVGAKLKSTNPMFAGDVGFRVFKLDSSNIRTWDPDRANLDKSLLDAVVHLKPERSEEDVLTELLLKLGLDLCVPIETRTIEDKPVQSIGAGVLLVCLAPSISAKQVEPLALGIAKRHKQLAPAGESTVVFRDSAFRDDVAKTNMTAILAQHGLANVRSL